MCGDRAPSVRSPCIIPPAALHYGGVGSAAEVSAFQRSRCRTSPVRLFFCGGICKYTFEKDNNAMRNAIKGIIKKICPKSLWTQMHNVRVKCVYFSYQLNELLHPKKMRCYCPCCGLKFESFIAGKYQECVDKLDTARYVEINQDVICPFCYSLPRHRILALWLEKRKVLLASADILYFAAVQSELLWMKRNRIFCTTADLYADVDLQIDIQDTKLTEQSYDFVICNHVLEHVEDFRATLKEVYRILRPEGSLICSFPMDPAIILVDEDPTIQTKTEKIRRFGQQDHNRIFGMNAGLLISDAGFVVEEIRGEDYPKEILPVIGPANYDMNILFHCRKTGKR